MSLAQGNLLNEGHGNLFSDLIEEANILILMNVFIHS